MDRFIHLITAWVRATLELLVGVGRLVVALFDWPAQVTGIPAELLAAGIAGLLLVAFWRSVGGPRF